MTWLVAGLRTPFARVDGALRRLDAIALSVPVAKAMAAQLPQGDRPDLVVWGTVAPNLGWSNIAREVVLDAGVDPATPAFSTVLACSTSMVAVFEAAGMLREDLSLRRLLKSDFVVINGLLASYYGQDGVSGDCLYQWARLNIPFLSNQASR